MTSGRVEVITSVERRRRWSRAEKQRLVAATLEPGAIVAAVAREAGVHPSQLRTWRRQMIGSNAQQMRAAATPISFAPVRVAEGASSSGAGGGTIDLELGGARLRISGTVDPAR